MLIIEEVCEENIIHNKMKKKEERTNRIYNLLCRLVSSWRQVMYSEEETTLMNLMLAWKATLLDYSCMYVRVDG
jgi:hypothetical protein